MKRFEIACVTMNQIDFRKIEEMNVQSNIIYANQTDYTGSCSIEIGNGHTARMISTETRGVGNNRNIALMYADAEVVLFADDDVVYHDDMEKVVLSEFDSHPDADVIIFHFETESLKRKQVKYEKTRKCRHFERMPWAGFRIACRLSSVKKANISFTTLFGGGCVFPSGEDSMWLSEARKKGLVFYVSEKTIGTVSFDNSTWFTGCNEKFFYGKGVYCTAVNKKLFGLWGAYYALRTKNEREIPFRDAMVWFFEGRDGFKKLESFEVRKQRKTGGR